jgi:hypothetical protein
MADSKEMNNIFGHIKRLNDTVIANSQTKTVAAV